MVKTSQHTDNQCGVLFAKMQDAKDKLNRILPPPCDNVKSTSIHMKYKPPKSHTQRSCMFSTTCISAPSPAI